MAKVLAENHYPMFLFTPYGTLFNSPTEAEQDTIEISNLKTFFQNSYSNYCLCLALCIFQESTETGRVSSEQHQLCGLKGTNFGFHGFRTKVWIHKDKMLVSKTERLHTGGHRDSEKKYTTYLSWKTLPVDLQLHGIKWNSGYTHLLTAFVAAAAMTNTHLCSLQGEKGYSHSGFQRLQSKVSSAILLAWIDVQHNVGSLTKLCNSAHGN